MNAVERSRDVLVYLISLLNYDRTKQSYSSTLFDFVSLRMTFTFRQSWDDSCNSSSDSARSQKFSLPLMRGSKTSSNTNALAMHFRDFIERIVTLVVDDSLPSPSYHPLVDGIIDADSSTDRFNCDLLHGCPLDAQGNIAASSDAVERTIRDPTVLLMSAKVFFTGKSLNAPTSFRHSFQSVWKEFTVIHKFTPCNLVIVGGPQCGQTEAAMLIAKRYDFTNSDDAQTAWFFFSEQVHYVDSVF